MRELKTAEGDALQYADWMDDRLYWANLLGDVRTALTLACSSLLPSLASAQILASEKGSVSQTVDGTTITVEGMVWAYRPEAR